MLPKEAGYRILRDLGRPPLAGHLSYDMMARQFVHRHGERRDFLQGMMWLAYEGIIRISDGNLSLTATGLAVVEATQAAGPRRAGGIWRAGASSKGPAVDAQSHLE